MSFYIALASVNIILLPYIYVDYLEYFIINSVVPFINYLYTFKNNKKIMTIEIDVLPDLENMTETESESDSEKDYNEEEYDNSILIENVE